MNYKISVEAGRDLEKIWVYTFETWTIDQADRYVNQIIDEIEYLALKPKSGKDFSYVRKNYLRSKVKFHYIFYRISKTNTEIEIIRILHERMDIENRLKQNFC